MSNDFSAQTSSMADVLFNTYYHNPSSLMDFTSSAEIALSRTMKSSIAP
jgi:hypothetical protein